MGRPFQSLLKLNSLAPQRSGWGKRGRGGGALAQRMYAFTRFDPSPVGSLGSPFSWISPPFFPNVSIRINISEIESENTYIAFVTTPADPAFTAVVF